MLSHVGINKNENKRILISEDTFQTVTLEQWFPTTVPRNTSVPQAVPKCSAEKTNLTYFTVLFELFGL
jgi:hypothetical protein